MASRRQSRKTHFDLGPGVFAIEELQRVEDEHANDGHYWRARLKVGDDHFEVDTKFGSWMIVLKHKPARGRLLGGETRKFVLPPVAADLQDAVHAEERKHG